MVASDRAIMLLSSLTASVTLVSVRILLVFLYPSVNAYISWLGFFFFLRMAVAVSSSCHKVSFPALDI